MSLRSLFQRLFESEDTTNLRERIELLETAMKRQEEEWTEVYGKFRTLQLRVAKHVQRLDKDSSQEEPQGAEGEETASASPLGMFPTLSPRARKLQEQILARRRGQTGGE